MKSFQREYGGTGGNIAYSLSLLDIPTVLVGAVGNDAEDYLEHLNQFKSLETNTIKQFDEKTARGFVTTDSDDNQIWGFYEGAMKFASEIEISKVLRKGDLLVVAPNDPKAMIDYVKQAVDKDVPYLFDPAFNIPHFRVSDLKFAIENAKILIGNDYEVQLIERRLHERISSKILNDLEILVTTLGPNGAKVEDQDKINKIPAAKPNNTSDPTGAGDAFRAGFLAGLYYDQDLSISGRMGALNAVYTVEKYGTQTHSFSKISFSKRFKENYDQKLML